MQLTPSCYIGSRKISANEPTYVIAEIGVNHNGDENLAHRMIDEAKAAGADAVKFQTYRTTDLVTNEAKTANYQKKDTGFDSQFDMLKTLELPFKVFEDLKEHCSSSGIDFISTAFDPISLEFVASLNPVCLKWPSGELTNLPLLRQAIQTKLPIMLSTGMGSLVEIAQAVDFIGLENDIIILQCISSYPAKIEEQNLRVLPMMQAAFGKPVGFSDHTIGPYSAIAARALGMSILEKHFTLDRNMEGPDHKASTEPKDFAHLVSVLRQIEIGLGDGIKRPQISEHSSIAASRKSLVYRRKLDAGHVIKHDDLTSKRPGTGLSPDKIDLVIGRTLIESVEPDKMVNLHHVE